VKLIDADAALETIRKMQTYKLFSGDDMILVDKVEVQTELMMLPSVQPERKTGRWLPSDSELEIKCNKCGKDFSEYVDSIDYIYLAEYPKFCPNCGADMRGDKHETD
jgi:hypothetical protein